MATFSMDEEQKQIKDTMEKFALKEMRPVARDCDEERKVSKEFLDKTWELGLVPNAIPEQYGGYELGRSALNNAIMMEELAYGDLSLAIAALVPNLFALPLVEMGTPSQKEKYLPRFCGEQFEAATLAIMEPAVQFDATNIKTTAVRQGDRYVLNGKKCLVPMADKAEVFLVVAAAGPDNGLTSMDAFIVEKSFSGVDVGEREKNMGLNALPTHTVTFTNCEVPVENRLGGEEGCNYARLINCSRIGLAAMAVGVARAVKDYCIDYAKNRVAFGQPIATRQAIAFMLAEMAIEVDAARMLTWKAAWKADKGEDCLREAYLAKSYASEWAFKIADYGISILGGHGVIREYPIEMWFRNARAFSMLEGTVMA